MSEQKRNSLTTLGTNKKEKKSKDLLRTVRITLTLPESNEEACPEFNYRVLLNSAEKKRKSKLKGDGHVNGIDPLVDDDDDKLKAIARQFEEKYGSTGRKKHGRFEDYVDLGAGYDENDPFIDNTDAYDEIVPEEITTAHGGFYINCGALEFKEVSDQSDGEEIKDLKNRKRLKKAKIPEKKNEETIKKRKFVSHEREILKKKKKRAIDDLMKKKAVTVKDLLREKRESLQASPVAVVEQPETKKCSVNSVPKAANTSITDVIESVVSAARADDDSSKESSSLVSKSATGSAVSSDSEESRDAEIEEEKEKNAQKEEVKLPDSLDDEVREIVAALKKAATSSAEGKCKFFSSEVNKMLLTMEQKCQVLPCNIRQLVYGHLALYLPCTKDTLMKRAKKLLVLAEEVKLKEPLKKLGAAISKIMPALMEKYTKDCQKVAEENPQMYMELYRYYWSIDESPSSPSDSEANGKVPEGSKISSNKPKIPRRTFPWTNELRGLLCEVVRIKLLCLDLKKPRKESAEEILRSFLDQEVKPLWPPGWMKVTTLMRESREARSNPAVKSRKTSIAKKVPSTVSTSSGSVVSNAVTATASNSTSSTSTAKTLKNTPSVMPANATPVANSATVMKSVLPVTAKSKISASEASAGGLCNTTPRTKNSSMLPPSISAQTHVVHSGGTTGVSTAGGNIRASSSGGKHSSSTISSVKTKGGSDIHVKTHGTSGKSVPNVHSEKQTVSVNVGKLKNTIERVPAKGLDLSLTSTNKTPSVPNNSNKCKGSSEISIIPVTVSSSSGSSQKSPIPSSSLINIPDCISVTPSLSSPVQTSSSTTSKPMSLKQRILYDTAKDNCVNISVSPPLSKVDDEIEVIEIDCVKTDGFKTGNQKQRNTANETQVKPKNESRKRRKLESSKELEPVTATSEPVVEEKKSVAVPTSEEAERQLKEETAAATDILSQIINESLTNFPNSSSREVYHHEDKSFSRNSQTHRTSVQSPVSPSLPLTRDSKTSSSVKDEKERAKDVECEKVIPETPQSPKTDAPQSPDTEASVQLEVQRVMKELSELRGHISVEKTSETVDPKYSPPKISSSVTVVPLNSVVNARSQQQTKPVKEPDVTCKPVSQSRRLSAGTDFSGVPKYCHGFREEFHKHLCQDFPRDFEPVSYKMGKNKAVYSQITPVTKSNTSFPSEDSSSHGRGSAISTQPRSHTDTNSSSLYQKHTSVSLSSVAPVPCDRRMSNVGNSSLPSLQDMKSDAHSSQTGVQSSLTPTDDQFSLPLMLQYNHFFPGPTQHSPPY